MEHCSHCKDVVKHMKRDMMQDEALMKKLTGHKKYDSKHHDPKKKHHESPKFKNKMEKVMHEFKEGALHSGSKKGPEVHNPKQAIAIALSEARKSIGKKKKTKRK